MDRLITIYRCNQHKIKIKNRGKKYKVSDRESRNRRLLVSRSWFRLVACDSGRVTRTVAGGPRRISSVNHHPSRISSSSHDRRYTGGRCGIVTATTQLVRHRTDADYLNAPCGPPGSFQRFDGHRRSVNGDLLCDKMGNDTSSHL